MIGHAPGGDLDNMRAMMLYPTSIPDRVEIDAGQVYLDAKHLTVHFCTATQHLFDPTTLFSYGTLSGTFSEKLYSVTELLSSYAG
ncbi:MAG: hypothetical protein JXB07_10630 [Anaerolineae bacterium]|nr:hypothetical protein [Anaerolineae bacterium]